MFKTIRHFSPVFIVIIVLYSCKTVHQLADQQHFLEKLMAANPSAFAAVLKNRDSFKVQVIYTRIDRDKNNHPHFTDYYFHVSDEYFYPASTVKMPVAFLALEKLKKLGIPRNATMITDSGYAGQPAVHTDSTAADGRSTAEHYIKKIFLVSDNDANNRLYEFLGQQYLHDQLKAKGYDDAQIIRRLAITMSEDEHRTTNPVLFKNTEGKTIYEQPLNKSSYHYIERNQKAGTGYINDENILVNEPMDFSRKNRIYLTDLHHILRSIIFPEAVNEKERFDLQEDDYGFLYKCMSQLPSETLYPKYDTSEFYDSYCKYLLFGTEKHTALPKHIRSFNKPGWSYGFLTDVAYIVDFDKNIEFMLSATIYCNADGILNDDKYDYDEVGLPFLTQLGKTIYEYEVKRKRNYQPDLSKFKITYDK